MTLTELLQHPKLTTVRKSGAGHIGRCPAHDDRTPSLSIREGRRGILLRCWAGCTLLEICAAASLTIKDLFYDTKVDPRELARQRAQRAAKRARLERARYREGLRLDVQREAERLIASARHIDIASWSDDRLDVELNRLGAAYAALEGDHCYE